MHWQINWEVWVSMWVSEGLNTGKNEQKERANNVTQQFWQATYPADKDAAVAGMVSHWVLQWGVGHLMQWKSVKRIPHVC